MAKVSIRYSKKLPAFRLGSAIAIFYLRGLAGAHVHNIVGGEPTVSAVNSQHKYGNDSSKFSNLGTFGAFAPTDRNLPCGELLERLRRRFEQAGALTAGRPVCRKPFVCISWLARTFV